MSRIRKTIIAVTAVLLSPLAANALPIVDQENFSTDARATFIVSNNTNFGRAQTFTVGLAGLFDSIDVQLSALSTLTEARILATSGGVPIGGPGGSTVLASSSLISSVGDLFSVDFSAFGLAVNVGDVLAIELIGDAAWLGSASNPYAGGGDNYFNANFGAPNWTANGNSDTNFRTYVDVPTGVPEPGTLALFGIGLLGMSVSRRKKSSKI
ncbi:MAG: PEP-CTERM sorting domain-containing protein [Woeseia sp.]